MLLLVSERNGPLLLQGNPDPPHLRRKPQACALCGDKYTSQLAPSHGEVNTYLIIPIAFMWWQLGRTLASPNWFAYHFCFSHYIFYLVFVLSPFFVFFMAAAASYFTFSSLRFSLRSGGGICELGGHLQFPGHDNSPASLLVARLHTAQRQLPRHHRGQDYWP